MKENDSFLKNNDIIKEFNSIMNDFTEFRNSDIPLCAAENIISDFSKKPLTMGLQERYILGGYLDYDINNNMIGSEKVLPLYHLLNKQCNKIFGSNYCDSRSLSGMNGMINILLALTKAGDTILLSSPDCGGHASLPNIIYRLGVKIIYAPFDYSKYDYDYDKINVILKTNKIDFVLLAPSDLITVPKFDLIDYYEIPEKVTKKNIRKHNLDSRTNFIKSDLLKEPISMNKKYDILVSNPPYIKDEVIETLMDDVKKYEPHTALSGGEDGLYFYKKIIDDSNKILKDNGVLAFEIGHDQGKEVSDLMVEKGYKNIRVIKDLAGHDRVVIGEI